MLSPEYRPDYVNYVVRSFTLIILLLSRLRSMHIFFQINHFYEVFYYVPGSSTIIGVMADVFVILEVFLGIVSSAWSHIGSGFRSSLVLSITVRT